MLTYGTSFWGNYCGASKIFILYKSAIRIIDNAADDAHYPPQFRKLRILPIPGNYEYSTLNALLKNSAKFKTHFNIYAHPYLLLRY